MSIKKLITTTLLSVVTAFSINIIGANSRVEATHHQLTVDSYDKVSASSNINVLYKQMADSANFVNIYAPVTEVENLNIEVKNGTLKIRRNGPLLEYDGVIIITIYTPTLSEVKCKSGAIFTTEGEVESTSLQLKVIGNSMIRAPRLNCGSLYAKNGIGQGDIIIGGVANYAEYKVIGNGDISAHKLEAKNIKCYISGKGNIGTKATKSLYVKCIGQGKAYQDGEVEIIGNKDNIRTFVP